MIFTDWKFMHSGSAYVEASGNDHYEQIRVCLKTSNQPRKYCPIINAFLVHISSGICNQMARPGWNKNEHIYFNANYTFKYRHKHASGTNTVLHMMLRITYQPKANINVVVLEKAMKEPWKPTCLKCSGLVLYFNF